MCIELTPTFYAWTYKTDSAGCPQFGVGYTNFHGLPQDCMEVHELRGCQRLNVGVHRNNLGVHL